MFRFPPIYNQAICKILLWIKTPLLFNHFCFDSNLGKSSKKSKENPHVAEEGEDLTPSSTAPINVHQVKSAVAKWRALLSLHIAAPHPTPAIKSSHGKKFLFLLFSQCCRFYWPKTKNWLWHCVRNSVIFLTWKCLWLRAASLRPLHPPRRSRCSFRPCLLPLGRAAWETGYDKHCLEQALFCRWLLQSCIK